MRIGHGYDSHRFAAGRRLVLGGVEIPHEKGLAGHSDADVLCHAIIDALLGAAGLGNIGSHFPDTDDEWKNAKSTDLLRRIIGHVHASGFSITWIDATVIAEQPRLFPHIEGMKQTLSRTGIAEGRINIKAKTNEGMGFTGRGEGIAAFAVCLLARS